MQSDVQAVLDALPTGMLIGGEWTGAANRKTFATIDPCTEEPILDIAEADASDIDAAIRAARTALERGPWPAMTGAERGHLLRKLADILRLRFEEIALLETIDAGKPLSATKRMDIPAALDCLDYYAGWADKISGEVAPVRNDALTFVGGFPWVWSV